MRFLVVGLGSMGKRRIRNLQALAAGEIAGYDPREDRREEARRRYRIPVYGDFTEAVGAVSPDAFVISTPPNLHMRYARMAVEAGKHFFCEASVTDEGIVEVAALCAGRPIVAAPSCTLRFHPSVRTIKELVDGGAVGRILGLTYHSGQYLPDWHPWEDIKDYYVSRRETGGCREIVPFELTWLTWVLGELGTISCFTGKVSRLDADIDDIYQLLLRFRSGVLGHLFVDVVSRVAYRSCRLIGEEGVVEWIWRDRVVRLFTAKDGWKEFPEPAGTIEAGYLLAETMYIEEMRSFVNAIRGDGRFPHTLEADHRILELLYAAERSSREGIHVAV